MGNRTGGLHHKVMSIFCETACKRSGPYCGRKLPLRDELEFVARDFVTSTNILGGPSLTLPERVMKNYTKPVTLRFPEVEYLAIKKALTPWLTTNEIEKIYLTGSILAKKTDHKDYDIVLKIASWKDMERLLYSFPREINGVRCDYFFTTEEINHGFLFVILDCETKTVFTSAWYDVNIAELDSQLILKQCDPLYINQYMHGVAQIINSRPSGTARLEVPLTEAQRGWNTVKETWTKAEVFFTSAKSRGLVATATNTGGEKAPEDVITLRKQQCFGGCSQLRYTIDQKPFCGACGCGSNKLAILTSEDGYSKLDYPYLECPLKKPGFSNASLTT